jgi:tRNA modification GTPase
VAKPNLDDTIVAISTPPGEGGVGIVRLSGSAAIKIAAKLFESSRGKNPCSDMQRVYHGHVTGPAGERLDEVLLHVMRAPNSFTREDVVEINGHGGAGPLNAILSECLRHGARLAGPGEFTQRAFLNGRIDLVQAEAIIDTIRARTRTALQSANSASSGGLSRAIHGLTDELRFALARVEAAVDFPEDDLGELIDPALVERMHFTHAQMLTLLDTADAGRLLREGATVAIAGRPNVGKSSLFNALLRDARAIVTAQPGTTRDRLEEYITIAGIPVKLVDTAGLRTAEDEVEQIGVDLARKAVQAAQIALCVVDASAPVSPEDGEVAAELALLDLPVVLVLNKIDLAQDALLPDLPMAPAAVCRVSALTNAGIGDLESALGKLLLHDAHLSADQALLTRAHQKDSLRRAANHVGRCLENLGMSPEFLALDLQEALQALGEITGETTPDDILESIFNSFCIGK